ncbi:hypothetical protein AMK24_23905 [Streptomyces sp. CB02366]|nr:hypothetical protein AMK24_23905 [Streptomyces sp. CB02366]TVP38235.1 hypothetical protein A3L22_22885 [Streptomyces griseus subsp. griseus]
MQGQGEAPHSEIQRVGEGGGTIGRGQAECRTEIELMREHVQRKDAATQPIRARQNSRQMLLQFSPGDDEFVDRNTLRRGRRVTELARILVDGHPTDQDEVADKITHVPAGTGRHGELRDRQIRGDEPRDVLPAGTVGQVMRRVRRRTAGRVGHAAVSCMAVGAPAR